MENEILNKIKIYSLYMRSKIISELEPEDILNKNTNVPVKISIVFLPNQSVLQIIAPNHLLVSSSLSPILLVNFLFLISRSY